MSSLVRTLLSALALCALLVSSAAAEEEPPTDPLRARQLYDLGKKLFAAGEFAEAAKMFAESHQLDPRPNALFNQGRCLEEDGQKAGAVKAYRAYIAAAPEGDAVDEARTRALALERELDLAGKNTQGDLVTGTTVTEPNPRARTYRLAGIGVAAGGLGLVGIGGLFGLKARSIESELNDRPEGAWTDEEIDRHEEGVAANRNAIIFASIGVTAVAAGAVLYVIGMRQNRRVVVEPMASPDGAGARVTLSF